MPKAYSYIRFSTPEQEHGDSYRRQTEKAKKFINDHPELDLVLDDSLKLYDKGISAYKGKNAIDGKLAMFLKAVEDGFVTTGSYLLVENHDRLSRDRVTEALHLFTSILRKGINIVTLTDSKIFSIDTLDEIDLIISLIGMSRAHAESERKGQLVKDAWDEKKRNIQKLKLTQWSPKWLNLSQDRTKFEIIEDRAEVVKKIFEWTVDGLGTTLIIKRLEELGIKPWDNGIIKTQKRLPKQWHAGIIQRILTDRTVLGEYKLEKDNPKDGYEIITDYFPRIIDEDLFYRARQARSSRSVSKRGGGRKGKTLSNLFSKLAVCGYSIENNFAKHKCAGANEVMLYINKGSKYPIKYLQCSRLRNGNTGCDQCKKMWRYDHFERSFLTHIKDIDASVLTGKPNDLKNNIEQIKNQIKSENGKLITTREKITGMRASLREYIQIPRFLIEEGIMLEQEEEQIKSRIALLEEDLKKSEYEYSHSEHKVEELSNLIKVMDEAKEEEIFDIRLKLSELLKQSINSIEVYSRGFIHDETYLNNLRETLGEEAEINFRKNLQINKKNDLPFYIVNYRSGEKRIITSVPNNPGELISTAKWINSNILDTQIAWSSDA